MNRHDARLRVFLVEDSRVLTRRLVEDLEADSRVAVVGTADNAGRAIEQIEDLSPDLLVIDIALASGTGFDVLRSLPRQAGEVTPTAMMFSNHSSKPYRDAARQFGAADFFDKSNDFVLLVEAVHALAEHRGVRCGSEG